MLEQLQDLFLLRADLASHQISYLETNQIGRGGPSRAAYQLLIIHPLRYLQESVDESVQVQQDIRV